MNRKRYQPVHGVEGAIGENVVHRWLRSLGIQCELVGGYGADLLADFPTIGMTPIEVETRLQERDWNGSRFRYSTYNLPERRCRKIGSPLFVLSHNHLHSMIMLPRVMKRALAEFGFVVKNNRHVSGEKFVPVPVGWILHRTVGSPLDIPPACPF